MTPLEIVAAGALLLVLGPFLLGVGYVIAWGITIGALLLACKVEDAYYRVVR